MVNGSSLIWKAKKKELDEDALNELYAKGRLSDEDLVGFEGMWQPI